MQITLPVFEKCYFSYCYSFQARKERVCLRSDASFESIKGSVFNYRLVFLVFLFVDFCLFPLADFELGFEKDLGEF